MTISKDGWFDWAIRDPGPESRWLVFGSTVTPMLAIYHHSLEGYFNPVAGPKYNVMDDPKTTPTAWHWSVTKDGAVYQHFPVFARLQHANGGNAIGPGGESEGFAGEPLTEPQTGAWLRIHEDMRVFAKQPFLRSTDGRTGLCEHREAPGAQTACPSERYAPLWAALNNPAEDEVTREEFEAFKKNTDERLAQLEVQAWGESRVPRGNPPATGYAPMNMYELASGRTAVGIPDHTHEFTVVAK